MLGQGAVARTVMVLVVSGVLALGLTRPSSAETAGEFLEATSQEAVRKLSKPDLTQAEREALFRNLMNEAFDIPRISKFVLGIGWRNATPEQRKEFIEVFEITNTQRFLPLFAEYAGDKLNVTRVRQDSNNPKLYFVSSTLERDQGAPIAVEWRIRSEDDKYKILDASAEGVSMALSLRQEYSEVVQNRGVEGLIAELRKKAAGQPTSSATANNP